MDASLWIVIYLPIFVLFFILIPSEQRNIAVFKKINKKRGKISMSNELIKKYVGKVCRISSGTLGSTYNEVKIISVVDNWVEVEKKGKIDLINIDYIQNIKILPDIY